MTIKEFFSFQQNKPFWLNVMALTVVAVCLIWGTLKAIDMYTRHGESVEVPDVTGMSVTDATKLFEHRGLTCVVADSTYVKGKAAGAIVDFTPAAGHKVKEGRTVYLTINALEVPMRAVPDIADNSSVRQAEATLQAVGFKLTAHEFIPGELDWVYGVKYRGHQLQRGEKVPSGATLTLIVGDGGEVVIREDSVTMEQEDTAPQQTEVETPKKKETPSDDSWF